MTEQQQSYGHNMNQSGFYERATIKIEEDRLLSVLAAELAKKSSTAQLNDAVKQRLPVTWKKIHGEPGLAENFVILPRGTASRAVPRWLIQLENLGATLAPLGIEIASDVIFGIERPNQPAPDMDFSLFYGVDKGVSRRHLMLRPSQQRLYLIDLNSTNGTRLNGIRINPALPVALSSGDLVSMGTLTFMVTILATPADYAQVGMD
jgi:hypothetical protein